MSDAVRGTLYEHGYVYDADLRDEILYGRVRPKLFTSEPSAVTFAYTHYCSVWLVVSPWRYKYLAYVGLLGLAIVVLPGPTLVLMLLLATPYLIFLAARRAAAPRRRAWSARSSISSCVVVRGLSSLGQTLFAERLHELQSRPRRQLLLPLHRPDAGRLRHVQAPSVGRRRPDRRALHRRPGARRLHELGLVPVGVAHSQASPTC